MPIILTWPVAPLVAAGPAAPSFSATMQDRILMFTRAARFKGLVGVFADRTSDLLDLCDEIVAAFDVETGTGDRLDKIGSILQRPRYGLDDATYRIILQIQIEIILSSTASTPSILRIVELYTGAPPSSYSEHYPMGFQVGAVVDPADAPLLLQLILEAKAAAYGATVTTTSAGSLILDADTTPVAGATTLDADTTPVGGAGTLDYAYVL